MLLAGILLTVLTTWPCVFTAILNFQRSDGFSKNVTVNDIQDILPLIAMLQQQLNPAVISSDNSFTVDNQLIPNSGMLESPGTYASSGFNEPETSAEHVLKTVNVSLQNKEEPSSTELATTKQLNIQILDLQPAVKSPNTQTIAFCPVQPNTKEQSTLVINTTEQGSLLNKDTPKSPEYSTNVVQHLGPIEVENNQRTIRILLSDGKVNQPPQRQTYKFVPNVVSGEHYSSEPAGNIVQIILPRQSKYEGNSHINNGVLQIALDPKSGGKFHKQEPERVKLIVKGDNREKVTEEREYLDEQTVSTRMTVPTQDAGVKDSPVKVVIRKDGANASDPRTLEVILPINKRESGGSSTTTTSSDMQNIVPEIFHEVLAKATKIKSNSGNIKDNEINITSPFWKAVVELVGNKNTKDISGEVTMEVVDRLLNLTDDTFPTDETFINLTKMHNKSVHRGEKESNLTEKSPKTTGNDASKLTGHGGRPGRSSKEFTKRKSKAHTSHSNNGQDRPLLDSSVGIVYERMEIHTDSKTNKCQVPLISGTVISPTTTTTCATTHSTTMASPLFKKQPETLVEHFTPPTMIMKSINQDPEKARAYLSFYPAKPKFNDQPQQQEEVTKKYNLHPHSDGTFPRTDFAHMTRDRVVRHQKARHRRRGLRRNQRERSHEGIRNNRVEEISRVKHSRTKRRHSKRTDQVLRDGVPSESRRYVRVVTTVTESSSERCSDNWSSIAGNDTYRTTAVPVKDVEKFLKKMDHESEQQYRKNAVAQWNYETNITEDTKRMAIKASMKLAHFQKKVWRSVNSFHKDISDPEVIRKLNSLSFLGNAALPDHKYKELDNLVSDMEATYSKAAVCDFRNQTRCDIRLDPTLTNIMANCREPNELKHYWLAWRTATGRQMGGRYRRYVELLNEAAVLNNMTDAAQMWLMPYDEREIRHIVRTMWEELRPLYLQLHAYVRRKLRDRYGEALVGSRSPIPAHLLGNMWGQTWCNLFNITLPAPASVLPDITARMQSKGYTPMRMFREAESFFVSLNLSAMPLEFWENSIIEKPQDGREMVCHASAWDMYDGKDFRIKMCTEVTLEDFLIIHHEMGHIQYYIQYSHLPVVFREGANPGQDHIVRAGPLHSGMCRLAEAMCDVISLTALGRASLSQCLFLGFHEAIGDVMSLSVSTLTHMHHLGFIKKSELSDPDADLNFLFLMALQKVAFLPFGYLVDKWRWDVFEGRVAPQAYNKHWWRLREKFQGVGPPEHRTSDDFDPGSKYHIAAGVPFIRYFISSIIQFQFHRALCIEAGLYNSGSKNERPLHQCDIYHNAKAGNLIKRMMQMGSSRPWPDAMEVMTGQRELTPSGILEYFAPLQRWLENENSFKREFIGWDSSFEQEERSSTNAHHSQHKKRTHSEDKVNQT